MKNSIKQHLQDLFKQQFGLPPENVTPLQQSGSDRQYFRLQHNNKTALGVYNANKQENEAYIGMTNHFRKYPVNVPEVLKENLDNNVYLVEDLGDLTLLSLLSQNRQDNQVSLQVYSNYLQALEKLAVLQIQAGETLDNKLCWQRKSFDKQSIMWDLNYFKYYFLKLMNTPYDEQGLEDDFHRIANFLLEAEAQHFMFRDFQARNIMIKDGKTYFIDFQGGRRGALQYDVVSLLFQAKANLPHKTREELLQHYLKVAGKLTNINEVTFRKYYAGFQLIRFLQVLGAYGFRGIFERKKHFLSSIPFGISTLKWWLNTQRLPVELPTLIPTLKKMLTSTKIKEFEK